MFKKIFFFSSLAFVLLISVAAMPERAAAAGEFIISVKTDNAGGVTNATSFEIPTNGAYTYNYSVDWDNDGAPDETGITGNVTHDFGVAGTYTIQISGTFPTIFFDDASNTDATKLVTIDQWGTNHWLSMYASFAGCGNMTDVASDVPDLSGVTNAAYMFLNDALFNTNINNWDVSTLDTTYGMFQSALAFNQPLNLWDVSHVGDISYMFNNAQSFNQDITGWNVSSATDMSYMFASAVAFNQDISGWDTSNATNMARMFENAQAFNQDLSVWNTSNVTTMSAMFSQTSFNQDIDVWDTSSVTDMSLMFYHNTAFDTSISSWDVSHVTNMNSMFEGATAFNNGVDWGIKTANVTNMQGMFTDATSFNQDITDWDTSSATTMAYMFSGATSFNQAIGSWDVSANANFSYMFDGASAFDQDLGAWDVSSATTMAGMFRDTPFDQDISGWDISNVTDMTAMFSNDTLSLLHYNKLLFHWANESVQSGVTFDGGLSTYCRIDTRASLVADNSWTITDGGVNGGCPSLTLTEVTPIPASISGSEATYYFAVSAGVDAALADGTGQYSTGSPACANCTVSVDTTEHTVTVSGLGSGERIRFSLSFTDANSLDIGPFTVSHRSSPSGAIHYGCTDPAATNYDQFSSPQSSLCVYREPAVKQENNTLSVSSTPALTQFIFSHKLQSGMQEHDVFELQKRLNALGFVVAHTGAGASGSETEYFGLRTKAAVMAFQKAHALPQVGVVGPLTRALLNVGQ